MDRLAGFPAVAYDTNCLVYWCLLVDLPLNGTIITVTAQFTAQTRHITDRLIGNNHTVVTTQEAYEELRNCIADAVEKRMTDREIEKQLGYAQGEKVPDQIKWKVAQSATRHAKKLESKNWFVIDRSFVPDAISLQKLQEFLDSKSDSEYGSAQRPSKIDRHLINFGLQKRIPLITNDTGISRFSDNMLRSNLSFHIYNLRDVRL